MSYPNVGKSLRIAQAMKDVKNIEMAARFNVKPQQVIRWRNTEDMSIHRVQEFADYFEMSLSDFIGLSDAKG